MSIAPSCYNISRIMDILKALLAFGALSQDTRLKTIKLLVKYGTSGCAACELSKKLKVPQNTLSFHLSHLSNADLVSSKRKGRSIIYFANFTTIEKLMAYLVENCCSAETSICLDFERIKRKKIC